MKTPLHFIVLCLAFFAFGSLSAQTTIVDYETPSTSTTFTYFGNHGLNGAATAIVANPDATGANTSANVGQFTKVANSETWAGAYSSATLVAPVDFTTGGQICIKVRVDHVATIALKLEGGTGPNWITTQQNTLINQWEEICFDAADLSVEGPFGAATGYSYNTIVLFFDFGSNAPANEIYLFDDIIVTGGTAGNADVTFSVDMNNYANPFTTVYVSGTFNGWSGNGFPLSDANNDGVWTGTYNIPTGAHQYKFTADNWAAEENFTGLETCVITIGGFHNRSLSVGGNMSLPTVCWNSCFACGQAVNITFQLGTSHIAVAGSGVFLAGGASFGIPGDYPMSDSNNDGVYTITVERPLGFSGFYAFTNGNCPDFTCKENLTGLPCGDPGNYNDRFMPPVMADTTISTCFGLCTTGTVCGSSTSVTFKLDMGNYTEPFTTPYVSGTFNGWAAVANPLSDPDGDNVWETTVTGLLGDTVEYKFQVDGWSAEETLTSGDACTKTTGTFVNRFVVLNGGSIDMGEVCWGSCEDCELVCAIPGAPTIVLQSPSSVFIDWADVNGAVTYPFLWRQIGPGVPFTLVNVQKSSTTLTGLTPNANHAIRLRSKCDDVTISDLGDTYTFRTPSSTGACGVPTIVLAEALSSTRVRIYWNYVPGATTYRLQFRQVGTETWTSRNRTVPNANINNVVPGVAYEYRVSATCPAGVTDYSAIFTYTLPGTPSSARPMADIESLDLEGGLSLYPNPASDVLNLEMSGTASYSQVRLINAAGQVVLAENMEASAERHELSVRHLPDGLYFVQLIGEAGSRTERVVIQR